MRYTPKILRGVLNSQIQTMGKRLEEYVKRPGRDFTRPRTLTFETVIALLLTMSENSLRLILLLIFLHFNPSLLLCRFLIYFPGG